MSHRFTPPPIPYADEAGVLFEQLSANYKRRLVESVFERLGGADGMYDAYAESRETRRQFTEKVYIKLIPRQIAVEATVGGKGTESFVKRLEAAERAEKATLIGESTSSDSDGD